jgi:L-ascorbate metabolism protein UlaG (beta-lactamase superfamily)
MEKEPMYRLRDTTVVEPLVNQWPAWAHLIPPVAAGLHLANYQIKTLQSYLENPEMHLQAARNPNLVGGPFVDIPSHRIEEVRELLEATKLRQARSIEFGQSITEFANWLVDVAKGESLESFYAKVPEPMRGYVELAYDYYNRPALRFLEGLLYTSDYYDAGLQSLRISQLIRDDSRPFFMTTPRLLNPGEIDLGVPFADERADQLFALDCAPQTLPRIREILDADESQILKHFTPVPPAIPEKWTSRTIRIRYIGHACVLLEWNGISILTDPYVGVRPTEGGMSRFSYGDLPEKIDFALVTHNHQDHFALETLLRLRHRIGCLVVPKSSGILYGDMSLKLMAQKLGFKRVAEMDSMESLPFPDGEIIAIPFLGEHADLAHGKAAYIVRAGGQQILFGADSNCLDQRLYKHLRQALGRIETVFIGMECVGAPLSWSCGPLFPFKPPHHIEHGRRYQGCDSKAALEILETVGANRVYNYAMGQEPWIEFLLGLGLQEDSQQIRESNALLARTRAKNFLAAERLYGTGEIFLSDNEDSARTYMTVEASREDSVIENPAIFNISNDAEDQFVF